jgi:phosphatidylethanolamine-binding protein (PEBP) family uncharacterized protein
MSNRSNIGKILRIPVKDRARCKKLLRTGNQCANKVSPGYLDFCQKHQGWSTLQIDYEKAGWSVNGQNVTASMASSQPDYCFDQEVGPRGTSGFPNEVGPTYALVMYDPDAPVAKAKDKSHLHWLIVNIDVNEDIIQSYTGPAPPPNSGVHHYIFSLLKQRGILNDKTVDRLVNKYANRSNFDYEEFKDDFDLEEVEKTYFTIST